MTTTAQPTLSQRPPGPKTSTFKMVASELRSSLFRNVEKSDILQSMVAYHEQYGDVVYWQLGGQDWYIFSHPDAIHQIVVEQADAFYKPPFYKQIVGRFLGNGILVSDGDFWRRQRRLAQPAFHHKRIDAYAQMITRLAQAWLAQQHDGRQIDAVKEMMALTLGVVAKTLFDADVNDKALDIGKALDTLQEISTERGASLLSNFIPDWLPTARNIRERRALKTMDEMILGIIRQRRETGEDRGDLLSMLLLALDESDGTGMTDQQARDEALTIFLAGYETTSNALAWTWSLLGQNPEAEARLHEELDEVLGGRPPTYADLPKLRYTDWVFKESLRLYPPAYGFGRQAVRDVNISGVTVLKGSVINIYPYIVHRDPRWFDNPLAFRPERWEGDLEKRIPKYAYFPFGGGPRICIGNSFALLEGRLVLASIAQRYRLRLLPHARIEPEALITLRPKYGVPVQLEARG